MDSLLLLAVQESLHSDLDRAHLKEMDLSKADARDLKRKAAGFLASMPTIRLELRAENHQRYARKNVAAAKREESEEEKIMRKHPEFDPVFMKV